jgi:hypothetical protein
MEKLFAHKLFKTKYGRFEHSISNESFRGWITEEGKDKNLAFGDMSKNKNSP